ncbi:MAG: aminotransferase class V-fold PLP-dependent enzyme [Acidobacteria bacterium]|nr:aminotransferase class V-fold PLP-dependent enzyme [Acidobacteriota bacterium]
MIYLDNAATSWPKPPPVAAAVQEQLTTAGGNPGRSGHRLSIAAARLVEETREALARLFHVDDPGRIAFAPNATHALNVALYGLLGPGDRVITTSLEHNSVMRPLRHLETLGVHVESVRCEPDGSIDLGKVADALAPGARVLVTTHASNVAGTILPVRELAALARAHGARSVVDAAQTAGTMPIDVEALGVDVLAFTGHKGLFGPTGTGGLYVREEVELRPLVRGGTGSDSAHEVQPEFMPDVFESGTLNVAGIAGLGAGVRFLMDVGIEAVQAHERGLATRFIEGVRAIPGVSVYGPADSESRCGIVSFNVGGTSPSEVGLLLDDSFGIMARTGLHCAPAAHRTLGTFPAGAVRFGFGWFNTSAEVDAAVEAVRQITAWADQRTPNAQLRNSQTEGRSLRVGSWEL